MHASAFEDVVSIVPVSGSLDRKHAACDHRAVIVRFSRRVGRARRYLQQHGLQNEGFPELLDDFAPNALVAHPAVRYEDIVLTINAHWGMGVAHATADRRHVSSGFSPPS